MMYYYSYVGYDYLVNSLCIVVLYYCLFVQCDFVFQYLCILIIEDNIYVIDKKIVICIKYF